MTAHRLGHIISWIITALISAFLIIASAVPKLFMMSEGTELYAFAQALGMQDIHIQVGILEVACAVLLLIPRTATVGFILTVGLLGGAMATGLTHDVEGVMPGFPLGMLLLLTFAAYFRSPELLDRLFKRSVPVRSRVLRVIGWICALLVAALNIFAAITKFMPITPGSAADEFGRAVGIRGMEMQLGILETIVVALFLIPRTSTVGFVLMVGYMGGVLATNITHGFGFTDVWSLYLALALLAASAYFRNPELLSRLLGRTVQEKV